MMKEDKIGGRPKYEVENDLRALKDAKAINSDSNRLSSVKILVKKEMHALHDIADMSKEGLGEKSESHGY